MRFACFPRLKSYAFFCGSDLRSIVFWRILENVFSGPAASSRLRLFEVIPRHVMFLV